MGRALSVYDSLVRAGFEFFPLPWLRVYRLLKNWLVNPPSGAVDEKTSMWKDLKTHWLTLLTAAGLFGLVVFIHLHANPHLGVFLFYALPCVLVALVVNTRWATLFVVAASAVSRVGVVRHLPGRLFAADPKPAPATGVEPSRTFRGEFRASPALENADPERLSPSGSWAGFSQSPACPGCSCWHCRHSCRQSARRAIREWSMDLVGWPGPGSGGPTDSPVHPANLILRAAASKGFGKPMAPDRPSAIFHPGVLLWLLGS